MTLPHVTWHCLVGGTGWARVLLLSQAVSCFCFYLLTSTIVQLFVSQPTDHTEHSWKASSGVNLLGRNSVPPHKFASPFPFTHVLTYSPSHKIRRKINSILYSDLKIRAVNIYIHTRKFLCRSKFLRRSSWLRHSSYQSALDVMLKFGHLQTYIWYILRHYLLQEMDLMRYKP